MNKEIKEILKILKKCEYGACITKHNATELLDYITNLQEENQHLQEVLDYQEDFNRYLNLIIDKAIEIYENRNSIILKKQRFMEDKDTGDLMYDILKG